jgi:hypothetical protein
MSESALQEFAKKADFCKPDKTTVFEVKGLGRLKVRKPKVKDLEKATNVARDKTFTLVLALLVQCIVEPRDVAISDIRELEIPDYIDLLDKFTKFAGLGREGITRIEGF